MRELIPNLITALNLLCGCIALACIFLGKLNIAPYFVLLAMVLDFFDGFVARLLGVSSELGKQMDSLADVVSFGLVPGTIVFQLINVHLLMQQNMELANNDVFNNMEGVIYGWMPFFGFIIPVFSAFRLAKFNIDTEQSHGFKGLNVPTNALFFISLPLMLFAHPEGAMLFGSMSNAPLLLLVITLGMSVLLVTRIPMFSLKFNAYVWTGNEVRFSFVIASAILILLELIIGMYFLSMPLIVFLYLILSLVDNYILRK